MHLSYVWGLRKKIKNQVDGFGQSLLSYLNPPVMPQLANKLPTVHRGLTETETHSFNDSRILSFTKWANNVQRIPYELGGGGVGVFLWGEEVRGEY